MVWNQKETDFFFLDAIQMGLSIPVQADFQLEGIIEVYELLEIDDDQWKNGFQQPQESGKHHERRPI